MCDLSSGEMEAGGPEFPGYFCLCSDLEANLGARGVSDLRKQKVKEKSQNKGETKQTK